MRKKRERREFDGFDVRSTPKTNPRSLTWTFFSADNNCLVISFKFRIGFFEYCINMIWDFLEVEGGIL